MELYREWGLADEMTAAALPPDQALGFGWMTRVNGIELGRVMLADDVAKLDDHSACTRERMTFIARSSSRRYSPARSRARPPSRPGSGPRRSRSSRTTPRRR
jgi:hypothetical protein